MTADILLFKATVVPVGEDQTQNLELSREIVRAFNSKYESNYFPVPKGIYGKGNEPFKQTNKKDKQKTKLTHTTLDETSKRIMSLQDSTKKMSKSIEHTKGRIDLVDDNETISKKIKSAKTDSFSGISFDPQKRPEISNLINLFSAFSGKSIPEIEKEFKEKTTGAFKEALTNVVISEIQPIREQIFQLEGNPKEIDNLLEHGRIKAAKIAGKNMNEIQKIIGLYYKD
jgi:tryptophanyl-tRNA synthetase